MINVFNPIQVSKSELNSSWCDNIKTLTKNRIPIDRSESPPKLDLECEPGKEWFIGAIPLNNAWKAIDLTKFNSLSFNIGVDRSTNPNVSVFLVSCKDGIDVDSECVSLGELGLMDNCEQRFNLRIGMFEGGDKFDLKFIKMVKFVGHGNIHIKLSEITID